MDVTMFDPAPDWVYTAAPAVQAVPGVLGDPQPPPTPPRAIYTRAEPPVYGLVAVRRSSALPLAQFRSANIEALTRSLLGVEEHRHSITVSSNDPAWRVLGKRFDAMGPTGPRISEFIDLVEWQVWRDGKFITAGISDGPVASGSRIDLRVSGGAAYIRDRYLGSGNPPDLLDGRGEWPTGSALTGWTRANIQWDWDTTTQFAGLRSLRVAHHGWLLSPWSATIPASYDRDIEVFGHAVMRINVSASTEKLTGVYVRVRRTDTGAVLPQNDELNSRYSGRPSVGADYDGKWQSVMAAQVIPRTRVGRKYQVQVACSIASLDWIDFGRIWATKADVVGAPPDEPLTLEQLTRIVVDEAQTVDAGGTLRLDYEDGFNTNRVREVMTWDLSSNPSVSDALSSLLDRADAPDAVLQHKTDGLTLITSGRWGSDQTVKSLTEQHVLDASIQTDTQRRYESLRVQTGYGSGVYRIVVPVEAPARPGSIRRRAVVQAPPELPFRAVQRWAEGAADAALNPSTLHVTVPFWYGASFDVGDTVPVYLVVDGWLFDGEFRIGKISDHPNTDTTVLELGVDGAA